MSQATTTPLRQPRVGFARRWLDANPSPRWELTVVSLAAWLGVIPHLLGVGRSNDIAGPTGIAVSIVVSTMAFTVMAAAMTLPPARPAAVYVARCSLPARRGRSVRWFAAGTVMAWVPFAFVSAVWHSTVVTAGPVVAAAGFAVVGVWTVSRRRLVVLRRCLRTRPIRAHGRAADRSAWSYGLVVGGRCQVLCGPAMAAVVIADHPPVAVAWLALTAWAERSLEFGERMVRPIAAGWGMLALATLVLR